MMEEVPGLKEDWLPFSLVLTLVVEVVRGWHGLGNQQFHCWPLNASADHPIPYPSCPGIDIDWVVAPPGKVKVDTSFTVIYYLHISSEFYQWAETKGLFDKAGTSGGFRNNPTGAEHWCETTVCPEEASKANQSNCCVHHVNVHSCPLGKTSIVNNGLCGPWIPAQGSIITHSDVMVGSVVLGNWTSVISGLYEVGVTSVIAHFKIAGMHLAVEETVEVLPRAEACGTCPSDCEECPMQDYEIALIAVSVCFVVIGGAAVFGYFQYQRRKLLWDESWIFPAEAIVEASGDGHGSYVSVMESALDLNNSVSFASTAIRRQLFTAVAYLDGRKVALKKINNSSFQLTKEIRMEVREIRSLEHPNLCRFLGGCIEVGHVCILYEYCPKGSLVDVLQNDKVPLTWAFRFSLLTDVTRGMAYLHQHGLVHGALKSSNCVVDDRWTCKVADLTGRSALCLSGIQCSLQTCVHTYLQTHTRYFGLRDYKDESKTLDPDLDEELKGKELKDRVYRAPETRSTSSTAIPASDVYSFAIILVEVATREDAYRLQDARSIKEGWRPELPQYSLDNSAEDKEYICPSPLEYSKLIINCWKDEAEQRPSFEAIKKTLKNINPNKLSPVDSMMAIMENYSKHLESVVDERTQQLLAEKQRTDSLLYSMMPRKVADDLKAGHLVRAEQFEACTIYFSDIVGFTDISGRSSPMQVVELLNKLYTTFDSIIEKYDVYKVETIGDAYMVVSGVPEKTVQHAFHIAMMSLEMVSASRHFQIPHLPAEPLKIRVGLHSGSVCAGVVGVTMPRYCLFGDTVNTASRMESNGEAYKIHISETTYTELQKLNKFEFEPRGVIPIKGKGELKTWWLLKVQELPSLAPKALSADLTYQTARCEELQTAVDMTMGKEEWILDSDDITQKTEQPRQKAVNFAV